MQNLSGIQTVSPRFHHMKQHYFDQRMSNAKAVKNWIQASRIRAICNCAAQGSYVTSSRCTPELLERLLNLANGQQWGKELPMWTSITGYLQPMLKVDFEPPMVVFQTFVLKNASLSERKYASSLKKKYMFRRNILVPTCRTSPQHSHAQEVHWHECHSYPYWFPVSLRHPTQ